jgi:ECF sigma factor
MASLSGNRPWARRQLRTPRRAPPASRSTHSVHFFAIAARLMRRILIKRARRRQAAKRGGAGAELCLDDVVIGSGAPPVDLVAFDVALTRLPEVDPRQEHIVELRFFWRTFDPGDGRGARHFTGHGQTRVENGEGVALEGDSAIDLAFSNDGARRRAVRDVVVLFSQSVRFCRLDQAPMATLGAVTTYSVPRRATLICCLVSEPKQR